MCWGLALSLTCSSKGGFADPLFGVKNGPIGHKWKGFRRWYLYWRDGRLWFRNICWFVYKLLWEKCCRSVPNELSGVVRPIHRGRWDKNRWESNRFLFLFCTCLLFLICSLGLDLGRERFVYLCLLRCRVKTSVLWIRRPAAKYKQ